VIPLTSNEQDAAALDKVFRHAAKGALVEWGIEGEVDDLTQNLWEWYQETPSTQRKMADLSDPERITTARRRGHQLISGGVLAGNLASGKVVYSTDSVREALEGLSTNKYLLEILPEARQSLEERNPGQAEALRSRYEDGIYPVEPGKSVLKRAVKALTNEVNVRYLTSDDGGVGRREQAAPNVRKRSGGYSDPTAGIALALMDNPDEREAFYEEWEFDYAEPVDAAEFPVNIMDSVFNGMPRSEFYRAQVFPELFPHEPEMLIDNWPEQDREMYCC
jgi:hypothetical protein